MAACSSLRAVVKSRFWVSSCSCSASTSSFVSAAGYAVNVIPGIISVYPRPIVPPQLRDDPLPALPIPEEARNLPDDSPGSEPNFGLAPVCPSFAPSLVAQQSSDMLGHEWLRVRSRHKLTICIDTERRNGCLDF
jgi:hypothetical protein